MCLPAEVERTLKAIRALAWSMIQRRFRCIVEQDVEDVVQETVLTLLEKGIALEAPVTDPQQFISVIDRTIYRLMRKETRRQRAVFDRASELIADQGSPSLDPASQILADDLLDFVKSRFSVFECNCLEHYAETRSLRVTAESMGVSLHRVRMAFDGIRAAASTEFGMDNSIVLPTVKHRDSDTRRTSSELAHTSW